MMLQIGEDGVVSKVDEEELIYVDKKELEELIESYHQLEKENKELKKQVDDVTVAVEVETCKVMENVLEVIDKMIKHYENKNRKVNTGDIICVKYYKQIECLKDLKRVLTE